MSVLELEKSVQALPPKDLELFAQWFDEYRAHALGELVVDDLTPEQREELSRRMALAREHPELLEPWEGTKDILREQLDAYCTQKTSGRGP